MPREARTRHQRRRNPGGLGEPAVQRARRELRRARLADDGHQCGDLPEHGGAPARVAVANAHRDEGRHADACVPDEARGIGRDVLHRAERAPPRIEPGPELAVVLDARRADGRPARRDREREEARHRVGKGGQLAGRVNAGRCSVRRGTQARDHAGARTVPAGRSQRRGAGDASQQRGRPGQDRARVPVHDPPRASKNRRSSMDPPPPDAAQHPGLPVLRNEMAPP